MTMWAHYSNNHQGLCVSYDMTVKENILLKGCTFPIQYVDKRIDFNCSLNNATQQMLYTKEQFGKEKGILSYHVYQLFVPSGKIIG